MKKNKKVRYFKLITPAGTMLFRSREKITNWHSLVPLVEYIADRDDAIFQVCGFWDAVCYLFTGR